ncbi:hypothetical protein HYX13_02070 [Candidatus Woesearchaeota archaeon]|nr:hypothetical protein [Candidatus Woesearchaeota archaeon]
MTIDKDGLFTFVRKEKNYALLAGTFETVENKISLVSGILESEEFGTISIDIPEEQPKTMIVFGEQISLMGGGIAFGDNFLFAGGVILHSPEHIEILKGSKLTLAIPGSKQDQLPEQSTSEKTEKKEEISRIFLGATKETDIFFDKKNHQGNKKSWIQISRNTLRVTAEDNAELTLGITSTPFKEVAVDSLRGIVTLNDELEGKKFSLILKRGRYSVVGPAKFSRRIVAEGVQFSPEGITNCKIYCQQVMGIEDDEFIQDSRTIEELLNEGKNAKDPYQRAAALAELEKQYGAADISTQEKIRQAWITALDDENQRVRLSALAKLALLQEIPMPHVIASLADDNLAIREFAVQILPSLKMDTQEKINLIQQTFAQEKEDEIKRVLLMSLSEMKENAPRRWIYSILRDKQLSNKVRNGAALAFIRLQTPEDKALLLETFLDLEETPEIRQTILYFSPDLFSTEEEWKNALLDKNPEVRKTAANHLVLAVEENKVNRIQILSEALIIEDTPDTKASQLFSMQSIIQQMPPKEVLDFVQNNPEIIGELMQQLNDKQMIKGGAQVGWLASAAYTSIVKSLEELATVSHSPQKEDALNTALDLEFARLITLEQIDPESNFRQKIEEIRKREYIHIKDIPFLLQVEKSDLAQTSDSLIAEIQQRSASQTHLSREDNPGYVSEGPEQVNELSYGELLKVSVGFNRRKSDI